jgi:hypothetical protein
MSKNRNSSQCAHMDRNTKSDSESFKKPAGCEIDLTMDDDDFDEHDNNGDALLSVNHKKQIESDHRLSEMLQREADNEHHASHLLSLRSNTCNDRRNHDETRFRKTLINFDHRAQSLSAVSKMKPPPFNSTSSTSATSKHVKHRNRKRNSSDVSLLVPSSSLLSSPSSSMSLTSSNAFSSAGTRTNQKRRRMTYPHKRQDNDHADTQNRSNATTATLTKEEKSKIYKTARQPVEGLRDEYQRLQDERRSTTRHKPSISSSLPAEVEVIDQSVTFFFLQPNKKLVDTSTSVGTMGRMIVDIGDNIINGRGFLEVDFHGLHVNEALQQFDEQVLPILSAVGSVVIITGFRAQHKQLTSQEMEDAKFAVRLAEQEEGRRDERRIHINSTASPTANNNNNNNNDNNLNKQSHSYYKASATICISTSKLKPSLQHYIDHYPDPKYKGRIKYENVKGNDGRIRVVWKPDEIDFTSED